MATERAARGGGTTAGTGPLVEFRDVSFAVNGGRPIIDRLSLQVERGETLVLLGESGCGKTTLLHLMAALDTPTGGVIDWPALGSPDTLLPAKISLVFQTPSLLDPLTVRSPM